MAWSGLRHRTGAGMARRQVPFNGSIIGGLIWIIIIAVLLILGLFMLKS